MYPRVFHLYGPLWIHSYGVMVAIGLSLFIYLCYRHPLRKEIISDDSFFNLVFLGVISGLVGGRLLSIILEWDLFKENTLEILYPWVGGFSMLGTIIALLCIIPFYARHNHIKLFPLLDVLALYAPLLETSARIGCFFAGCCHGTITHNSFFSITYTDPATLAPLHVPLHPIQLYASIASFVSFLFLYLLFTYYFMPGTGQLFFCYLIATSAIRFTTEFWRGDITPFTQIEIIPSPFQKLSAFQYIALVLFFGSFIGLWKRTKNYQTRYNK